MNDAAVVSQFVTAVPAPALRGIVDRYVGYRLKGFPPGLHRGLPARHQTFIVSIGAPIRVIQQTDPLQAPNAYRAVLSGLQASAAIIAHDGNEEGVCIELTPLGSRVLFGMPARELWNHSLEYSDVAGRVGDELWERLQHAPRWEERFAVCDQSLCGLVSEQRVSEPVQASWRLLVASGGGLAVSRLADTVGYSRQHLARRFRDEFGLGPKLAARVIRFERARRLLTSPSPTSIAGVAAACGYYDQAHLHRDSVDLAGCTPRMLLREELPPFQDAQAIDG